jgi:hypothetical protein
MLCFEKTGHGLRATDTETGEQRTGLLANEAQLVAFSWARGERMAFTAPDPPPAVLNYGDKYPEWDRVPLEHKWRLKSEDWGWFTATTMETLVQHLADIHCVRWGTLSQRPEARDA